MAARLSEDSSLAIAVIEAGTYYEVANPLLSSTPAGDVITVGSSPLDTNPLVDWNFLTAPQAGVNGRQLHYARGKCLGGRSVESAWMYKFAKANDHISSARNFMIYQRGDAGSY